jgi:hypothetical protein
MILFNAAWVGAYWERLLVLPLEQRRVAGRERPSEQRLEGLPGYSEELRVHLRRHRAPISAIRSMDIPVTVRLRAAGLWISGLRAARLWLSGLLGKPRLLRSSGLWIPRLLRTARLPLRGLEIAKQLGVPLLRTLGLCTAKRLGTAPPPLRWRVE